MGQRHQAFAIAKIRPRGAKRAFYHVLAMFHHQYCLPEDAIPAAHRFITLLKHPDNAKIILHEIEKTHDKYGRFKQEPLMPETPCPYILFLLGQAWDVDLEGPRDQVKMSGISFQNDNMGANYHMWDGDNNTGVSIIDVTDPFKPAYCFAVHTGDDSYPLSAEEYCTGFSRSFYGSFELLRVLTKSDLLETWPSYAKVCDDSKTDLALPECSGDSDREREHFASLSELALYAAVEHDRGQGLEDHLWKSHTVTLVEDVLCRKGTLGEAFVPTFVELVKRKTSRREKSLELFAILQPGDLLGRTLVDAGIQRLDSLVFPRTTSVDSIRGALTHVPAINRLDLLKTFITPRELAQLLGAEPDLFHHVEEIIHPLLFHPGPEETDYRDVYKSAFTLLLAPPNHETRFERGLPVASLPTLHPPQIVQSLTDFLSALGTDPKLSRRTFCYTTHVASIVMSGALRAEGARWSERHVSSWPKESLDGLRGNGWVFLFRYRDSESPRWNAPGEIKLGFVKVAPGAYDRAVRRCREEPEPGRVPIGENAMRAEDASPHAIYTVSEFIRAMEDEGRPVPSPEAVLELERATEGLRVNPRAAEYALQDRHRYQSSTGPGRGWDRVYPPAVSYITPEDVDDVLASMAFGWDLLDERYRHRQAPCWNPGW